MVHYLRGLSLFVLLLPGVGSTVSAQHRRDPADPRPDFLPHYIYYSHTEYRKAYNRPRFTIGYLAAKLEPTSQEAFSWRDSYRSGAYGTHARTPYPVYNYPKPWEALETGPRYDSRLGPPKVHSDEGTSSNQDNASSGSSPTNQSSGTVTPSEKSPVANE